MIIYLPKLEEAKFSLNLYPAVELDRLPLLLAKPVLFSLVVLIKVELLLVLVLVPP